LFFDQHTGRVLFQPQVILVQDKSPTSIDIPTIHHVTDV
jgi:hypothetical protein